MHRRYDIHPMTLSPSAWRRQLVRSTSADDLMAEGHRKEQEAVRYIIVTSTGLSAIGERCPVPYRNERVLLSLS